MNVVDTSGWTQDEDFEGMEGVRYLPKKNAWKSVTVQHPHLTSLIEGEETFFPRPWWEGGN